MDNKLKYLLIGGCAVTIILIVIFTSSSDDTSTNDGMPVYMQQNNQIESDEEAITNQTVNMVSDSLNDQYDQLQNQNNELQSNTEYFYNNLESNPKCDSDSLHITNYLQHMFNSDYHSFVKGYIRNDTYYDNLSDNMNDLTKLLINSESNIIKSLVKLTKAYKNILAKNDNNSQISNEVVASNNLILSLKKYNFEHIKNIQQIVHKWFESLYINIEGLCISSNLADELYNNMVLLFSLMSKTILIVQKISNINNKYFDLNEIVHGKIGFALYITYQTHLFDDVNFMYPHYIIDNVPSSYMNDTIDICGENNIINNLNEFDGFNISSNCDNVIEDGEPLYLKLKNPPNPEYKSVDESTDDINGISIGNISSMNVSLCPDRFGLCNNSREICNDIAGICPDASGACPDITGICPDGSYVNTCPDASGSCVDGSGICVDVNDMCPNSTGVCPDASGLCPDGSFPDASGLDASGLDASGLDASGLDASGEYYEYDNYLQY